MLFGMWRKLNDVQMREWGIDPKVVPSKICLGLRQFLPTLSCCWTWATSFMVCGLGCSSPHEMIGLVLGSQMLCLNYSLPLGYCCSVDCGLNPASELHLPDLTFLSEDSDQCKVLALVSSSTSSALGVFLGLWWLLP